jgi:rare lipoprotein A
MPFSIRSLIAAAAVTVSFAVSDGGASAETGRASWYALTSKTASGERCDPRALTAAHRSLPFGTKVKVENLKNGRSVVVRINDRGPFIAGRIIDLTKGAATRLGFIKSGVTQVRITVLG